MKPLGLVNHVRSVIPVLLIVASMHLAGCNEVRVRVLVEDEQGDPIPEAQVSLSVYDSKGPGMGWGVGAANRTLTLTNQQGRASLRSRGSDGSGAVVVEKEGYYPSFKPLQVVGRTALGNWRLENNNKELTLREKRNPIPMLVRRVTAHIPVEDEAVGFDLFKADWVAPHGEGEVKDIMFTITRGEEKLIKMGVHGRKGYVYDTTLTVEFQGRGAGVQVIPVDQLVQQSAFIWPYEAPFAGYESNFVRHKKQSEEGLYSNVNNDLHHFIKVRPIFDENGVIQTVHYGKMKGDFDFAPIKNRNNEITFTYYLNPEPNSRNIEFDPQ